MNAKTIVDHLCDRYGARSLDLTPWTRVWKTRSGHTYCVKPEYVCHRYPNGEKHNYRYGQSVFDAIRFIDRMEGNNE